MITWPVLLGCLVSTLPGARQCSCGGPVCSMHWLPLLCAALAGARAWGHQTWARIRPSPRPHLKERHSTSPAPPPNLLDQYDRHLRYSQYGLDMINKVKPGRPGFGAGKLKGGLGRPGGGAGRPGGGVVTESGAGRPAVHRPAPLFTLPIRFYSLRDTLDRRRVVMEWSLGGTIKM